MQINEENFNRLWDELIDIQFMAYTAERALLEYLKETNQQDGFMRYAEIRDKWRKREEVPLSQFKKNKHGTTM